MIDTEIAAIFTICIFTICIIAFLSSYVLPFRGLRMAIFGKEKTDCAGRSVSTEGVRQSFRNLSDDGQNNADETVQTNFLETP
jgi:hypothetical protein